MRSAESAPGIRRRTRSPGSCRGSASRALLGSVLLHAAIGIGLWHLDRAPAATTVIPPAPVPIELLLSAEIPLPPPLREPESTLESIAEPAVAPVAEPVVDPIAEPDDSRDEPVVDEPVAEPPTDPDTNASLAESAGSAEAISPPEDPQRSPETFEREPLVPENVDLEAVRREAVARVVATLRERAQQRTFSSDDLPGTSEPAPENDAPSVSIFEAAAAARSEGVLARGRARSRIARNIVELCNQLTGGFSVFGLVNVCADPPARADLFGHLRPEYMERVPLCTAQEELQLQVVDTGAGALGEFKCVLVPREIRADYYSRYDPALAGWLPAEDVTAEAGGP